MARLIYSAIQSVGGYVADRDGRFEWTEPDEEVHAFINDLERSVGIHLLGRRMYEVLLAWETMHTVPDLPAHLRVRRPLALDRHFVPAVVGGGTRSLPEDLDLRLELLDERRFASGFVFLRFRVTSRARAPRPVSRGRSSSDSGRSRARSPPSPSTASRVRSPSPSSPAR